MSWPNIYLHTWLVIINNMHCSLTFFESHHCFQSFETFHGMWKVMWKFVSPLTKLREIHPENKTWKMTFLCYFFLSFYHRTEVIVSSAKSRHVSFKKIVRKRLRISLFGWSNFSVSNEHWNRYVFILVTFSRKKLIIKMSRFHRRY